MNLWNVIALCQDYLLVTEFRIGINATRVCFSLHELRASEYIILTF